MSIPHRLYKYRSLNERPSGSGGKAWSDRERTEEIFRENNLWFSSPLDFNDPFEGRIFPDFTATEERYREALNRSLGQRGLTGQELNDRVNQEIATYHKLQDPEKIEEITKRIMARISTLCFSEANDCILQWSHYADNHRGVCLEFSTSDPNSYFSKVWQVEYEKNYPRLRILSDSNEKIFSESNEEQIRKFIFTKSDHWTYEREWRVFEIMADGFTRCPGSYAFSPDSLTGVIFGCRMTPEEIRDVIPWLEGRDPRPRIYRAGVKSREFGLQIDPLELSLGLGH